MIYEKKNLHFVRFEIWKMLTFGRDILIERNQRKFYSNIVYFRFVANFECLFGLMAACHERKVSNVC